MTLVSMFVGAQLFGVVGLFGFPIGLSLLRNLNDTGVLRIFRGPVEGDTTWEEMERERQQEEPAAEEKRIRKIRGKNDKREQQNAKSRERS